MVTDVNYTYCGDYFLIFTNIESLYFIPGTNVICELYLKKVCISVP